MMGKVSHEKTRIATRSVNHACNIAMRAFLLFLLLGSDEFVGVWIPGSLFSFDDPSWLASSRCRNSEITLLRKPNVNNYNIL